MPDAIDSAIDRLVDSQHESAEIHGSLSELAAASPPRVARALIARASPWPTDAMSALARAADAVVRLASCRTLLRIDSALRGISVGPARNLEGVGLGWSGLLSMQRDGYTREAATHRLAGQQDPLALRLLMLRCNDVVPQVSSAANAALLPWLTPARAAAWSHGLPLAEAMRSTVRASRSGIPEAIDKLCAHSGSNIDTALDETAARSLDPETRRLTIEKLVARPLAATMLEEVLRRGLNDSHPRVRMTSARLVGSREVPQVVRDELLPQLEANAAPHVRLLALRIRRKADRSGATPYLLAATLDANANVRHHARRYLARVQQGSASRGGALQRLADSNVATSALIGALAALSDVGRCVDAEAVRRFVEHPVRRVRDEAMRTLGVLRDGAD